MVLGFSVICQAAQADRTPPKELIQYVRGARQRGESEARIQQQAAALGWPEGVVEEAIAYDKSGKPIPETPAPVAVAAAPPIGPSASFEVPRADPVAVAAAVPDKPVARSAVNPSPRGGPDDYRIGSGDTLQISVWEQADLSVPTQVVRSDGKITLPLIKEIAVAGLTERQAEATIAAAMGKFVTDPIVTVVVTLPTSKKVYLVGAVRKEGTLAYTYGMTVMQALSEAGGLNDYAKKTKIYILRTESGREYRLEFNYKEVVRGERMEQNIVLLPGDTVVVPQ
jgi:polysaccharide export outer membrane protein